MVIDDDENNLLAISTVLEDLGEVVIAKSGEEALRALLHGDFAVILLDVYMPGMDGYEVARMVRGREQTKRIPIIFLSAVNKEMEHLLRGYAMGAVDYVFKPVEPVVLRSKVAVFVDLFAMTREILRKAEAEQALVDANLRANDERLRAEQALRLAEQRQAAIIQSLPIILYLEDMHSAPRVPKFVSGNFQSVTGFSADELLGNPGLWDDRLHPEDRAQVTAALAARDRGGSFGIEYRWQCADGRYRHFLDQAVLLRDGDGRPLEFAGTLLDVTERKDLETQLLHVRKMDAIGKLTGGIAHDFNNLLAAVIGGLGIIERRAALSDDHRKILTMTQHAAGQGTELVSRLLAFARKQRLEPSPVDLRTLADSVSNLLSHTLGGLVEIEWDIGTGVSPYADETQLELALMNLAINARDAMPQGGTIRVSARDMEVHDRSDAGVLPGAYIALTVADTGCGIAPDLIERVMEPFFTTKAVGKGTGLGLSMVYGFASQSGGTVRIESREGEGTRVALLLPKAIEGAAASSEAECEARIDAGPALSILLVDDHDGVRATTAALLEELGHRSFAAADGPSILEKFNSDPIGCDLLISDYAMPHLSGVEVIRRARQVRPELPAIIITGYADNESIDLGCENIVILNKPFSPLQLQQTILNATGFS
ncbi:MAG: response regulator [Pseudomonadota bacterium]|nr:response regulator [Pseudomonadota bacterium]